jgi:hypothetical protein
MTATITIHRMHARLCVAPGDDDAAGRLKLLLREVLDKAFELALKRRGLDGRGELCIRHLHAPVRLNLAAVDSALIGQWAQQMADAVAGSRTLDGSGFVHYGSRAHALVDLTLAATAGDFTRAWAWHSIGLWPAADAVTEGDAAGLVLRALSAERGQAVAALACLAWHPRRFERWWRRTSPSGLEALAQAVLLNAGGGAGVALSGPATTVAVAVAPARREAPLPPWLRDSAIARVADRLAGPAARSNPTRESSFEGWPASHALSVLAVADAEPARLLGHGAGLPELVDALTARWGSWESPQSQPRRHGPSSQPGREAVGAAHRLAAGSNSESRNESVSARGSGSDPDGQAPPVANETGNGNANSPPPQSPGADLDGPSSVDTALPVRARSRTVVGGLLFLLNLAEELGWPARWLDDPLLGARGTRWGLHQLALRLLPLADRREPAALAFAGLLPGADPPGDEAAPPDAAEEAALAAIRVELLAALRVRLPNPPDDDSALLAQVCKREGEILADPGWLELHLSLDEVRTEVRVAGLDLDPGWVPWLGLVIRFVYG